MHKLSRSPGALAAACMPAVALLAGLGWASGGRLVGLLGDSFPGPPPGSVELWVCDRDANELVGLDRANLVAARFAVPGPRQVVVRPDGQLWVACAVEGEPGGAHEVWLMTGGGRARLRHEVGAVLDLDLCGEQALVLERSASASARATLVGAGGLACDLGEVPAGHCVAGDARGRALVGTRDGTVLAFAPATAGRFPALEARRVLFPEFGCDGAGGSTIQDLVAGPEPGTWWALVGWRAAGRRGTRICLLGEDLGLTWWVEAGDTAADLIAIRGQERAWIVCADGRGARRFGPGGCREVPWAALPMLAQGAGVGLSDGGVVLVSPGALIALGPEGRVRPGQGGFDFLVAAEP